MTDSLLALAVSSGFIGALALLVRALATALEKRSEAVRLDAQTHDTEATTESAVVKALIKRMEASEARCAALEADREAMRGEMDAMREEMAECERRSIVMRAQVDEMTAAFSTVRPDRCARCGGIVAAG